MSVKLDLLKTLIENYGLLVHYDRKTTMDMWIAAKQLMPVRNLVAHRIAAMLDHKIPVVVSYGLPTTTGNVVGEACNRAIRSDDAAVVPHQEVARWSLGASSSIAAQTARATSCDVIHPSFKSRMFAEMTFEPASSI